MIVTLFSTNLLLSELNSLRTFQSLLPSHTSSGVTLPLQNSSGFFLHLFPVSLQVIENIFLLRPYHNGKTTLSLLQVELVFKCLKLALVFPLHEIFDCYGACGLIFVVQCPVFRKWIIVPQNHCHSLVCCIGFLYHFSEVARWYWIFSQLSSLILIINLKFSFFHPPCWSL